MDGLRVVFTKPGTVVIESFEVEPPRSSEVLVETLYTLLSPGTERAFLHALPFAQAPYPIYPGYSLIGRVVTVGSDVEGRLLDHWVAVSAGHASHVVRKAQEVWPVAPPAEKRELKNFSFFMLAAVAIQGIRRARVELGEPVLILGLGLVGLLAAQCAQLSGGFPVLGLDPELARRQAGLAVGLDGVLATASDLPETLQALCGGQPPAVVVEASGFPAAVNDAFRLCGPRGRVVLLGCSRGPTRQVDFYHDVHRKGITVLGAHNLARPLHDSALGLWTNHDDVELAIRLIHHDRLCVAPLLTHHVDAANVMEAYETVSHSPKALGVLLHWPQQGSLEPSLFR